VIAEIFFRSQSKDQKLRPFFSALILANQLRSSAQTCGNYLSDSCLFAQFAAKSSSCGKPLENSSQTPPNLR
jgi:hypothetical protein